MAQAQKNQAQAQAPAKAPAQKANISQLVVMNAYVKNFKSGKSGFHGKVVDPATGKRYQITAAVEIGG